MTDSIAPQLGVPLLAGLAGGVLAAAVLGRLGQHRGWWWLTALLAGAAVCLAGSLPGPLAAPAAFGLVAGGLLAVATIWCVQRGSEHLLFIGALASAVFFGPAAAELDAWRYGRLPPTIPIGALALALGNIAASRAAAAAAPAVRALHLGLLGLLSLIGLVADPLAPELALSPRTLLILALLWLPPAVDTGLVAGDRKFGIDGHFGRAATLLLILLLGVLVGAGR